MFLVGARSSFAHALYAWHRNPLERILGSIDSWERSPQTPKSIIVAGNFVCMTNGSCLGSMHNHRLFLWVILGSDQRFSHQEKKQSIPGSWYFNNHFVWIRRLFFFFVFVDMNWPLRIKYDLYRRSSFTILPIEYLETLSSLEMALIDILGLLSITFCTLRINLGVLTVLVPLAY